MWLNDSTNDLVLMNSILNRSDTEAETQAHAEKLGNMLRERNFTVSCAESCTGGGIAYAITGVAGSSAWFNQSWVTYSNLAKQQQLGVPSQILEEYGAVSKQTALAMIAGVLAHSEADLAVSVTGIAGPGGGSEDKPVGLVWFGFAINGSQITVAQQFTGNRKAIRQQAINFALTFLIERLVV